MELGQQDSIEQLLAEQALAAQRVATINQLLARRFGEFQAEQAAQGGQSACSNGIPQSARSVQNPQSDSMGVPPLQMPATPRHAASRSGNSLIATPQNCSSVPEQESSEHEFDAGCIPGGNLLPGGSLLGWMPWRKEPEANELHQSLLGRMVALRRQKQGKSARVNQEAVGRLKLESMFPDVEATKENIMEFLVSETEHWDSEHWFFDKGCAQWIVRHNHFKHFTLLVIVLNALWLSIDTDFNHAVLLSDAPLRFQVVENFFCFVFSLEIFLRFCAYRSTLLAITDPLFMCDWVLVVLMVWQTWVAVLINMWGDNASFGLGRAASVLRVLRLLRVSRVVRLNRLVRAVPELAILVKGIVCAMRSVAAILTLECLVIYVFAIIFTVLLSNQEATALVGEGKFQGVLQSCNFLLLQVLCGIDADFLTTVLEYSVGCYMLFLFFVLVAQVGLLNMLTGVICDVIGSVAEEDKEEAHLKDVEHHIGSIARSLDSQGSGEISRVDFQSLFDNPELIKALHNLGVDVVGLLDFVLFKLRYVETIKHHDFLKTVSQLRVGKTATVKDVMDMRSFVSAEITEIHDSMNHHESKWF